MAGVPEVAENIQRKYVCIKKDQYVWTLSINTSPSETSSAVPMVLLHGVATGCAMWILNLASFAAHRTVYAIDMLGFGRSSRVTFSVDPVVAEMELVESLEAWRQAIGLDTFVLVGHCFGAYIGTSYAIRYPQRVRHLMLLDPWGFSERSTCELVEDDKRLPMPLWVRTLSLLIQPFNPFAALRLAGSWGM
jgi:pimeloyl-ACP methyl ester carboxylesterase